MTYKELTGFDLLSAGPDAAHITDQPWLVRWDLADEDVEQLIARALPTTLDFWTSGSTGPSQCWRRSRDQHRVDLMVADPATGQTQHWLIECANPGILNRVGWKFNMLQAGDRVTVIVAPLRTGEPALFPRIVNDRAVVDARTVLPDQDAGVVAAIRALLGAS